MHAQTRRFDRIDTSQIARYFVNGLTATAVHFAVLTLNLRALGFRSAGIANLLAAIVGISVSFLGNRYWVFRKQGESILDQAAKFGLLYGLIACLHGAVLCGWSDVMHFDYRSGFLIATCMQMVLSYLGNRALVFRA
jgi:putative flippase GtrA